MINRLGSVEKHHSKEDHNEHSADNNHHHENHDNHDHEDHHHVDFELTENKKYFQIKDFNKEMIAIYGFQGWQQDIHPVDPYAHVRENNKFSLDYWYHHDPYHHKDIDEPLINTPHGYLIYEDPLDTRQLYGGSMLNFLGAALTGFFLLFMVGRQGIYAQAPAEKLLESNICAQMIEDEIRKIRVQNYQLEQEKQQLLAQLSQKNQK